MNKRIELLGLSNNPSDYKCTDGNLSSAINVTHDSNSIVATKITSPSIIGSLNGKDVIYHHKTDNFDFIIYGSYNGSSHRYGYSSIDSVAIEIGTINTGGDAIININSIGNTLIVWTGNNVFYYRYKTGSYTFIGNHLPELKLSFTLTDHEPYMSEYSNGNVSKTPFFSLSERQNPSLKDFNAATFYGEIYSPNRESVTNSVLREINNYISKKEEEGRFVYPFFVRYAYRLYDGTTLTMHSAPILMVPNNGDCTYINLVKGTSNDIVYFVLSSASMKLAFFRLEAVDYESWEDIIHSVDFFVSKPFVPYYQDEIKEWLGRADFSSDSSDGEVGDGLLYSKMSEDKCIIGGDVKSYFESNSNNTYQKLYRKNGKIVGTNDYPWGTCGSNEWEINSLVNSNGLVCSGIGVKLNMKSEEDYIKEIKDCSSFYLVSSIGLSEIPAVGTKKLLPIKHNVLKNISTNELMTGEYESHNTVVGKNSVSYNNRITIADVKSLFWKGPRIETLQQRTYKNEASIEVNSTPTYIFYKIIKNGIETLVGGERGFSYTRSIFWLFYPDPDVKSAIIFLHSSTVSKAEVVMDEHVGLNGSSYFKGFSDIEFTSSSTAELFQYINSATGGFYSKPNEIRTSEVNNPFAFNASNIELVGNGKIIAMVPQSIALSQGQFGQYPMTCFTTDGIWALSVNDTGGWAAKQPFSRDVVLNEDAGNILQLDRQIMFATNRGLMMISGSNVECISDVLNGTEDSFDIYNSGSKSMDEGYQFLDQMIGNLTDLKDGITKLNFRDFISNAVFLYDYTHQRIIIGNPDEYCSLVFNEEDRLWTTIAIPIKSAVNSYPECYAIIDTGGENMLVDFSRSGEDAYITDPDEAESKADEIGLAHNGVIITRPLKLDAPDLLKTVSSVIVRGKMDKGNVCTLLLGSRDMVNWAVVGSSNNSKLVNHHGTPYKYFRVVLLCNLSANESIDSIDVEYEVKGDNKLR